MHNKVNGLLHDRRAQTAPVGTSARQRLACPGARAYVYVAAIHQKSEEKMTETEFSADRTPTCVCLCENVRAGTVSCVAGRMCKIKSAISWWKYRIAMVVSVFVCTV